MFGTFRTIIDNCWLVLFFLMDPFKQMIFQYITLSFSFNNRCRAFFFNCMAE